jgi:GAF domain-containing protein
MAISTQDLHRALKELDSLRYGVDDLGVAMRKLVETTHALFGVDGAALMLIGSDLVLRNAAVSDPRLEGLEELQLRLGEGPGIEAYETKELVCSPDLGDESRWPSFCSEAVARGIRSLLASPIPFATDAIGVVVVFAADPRAWTPEGELAIMAFTDLAALLIANTMHSQERGKAATELQQALDARRIVEQAKGVLVGRDGLTPRQALERLRSDARRSRRRLADVAEEVVRQASGQGSVSAG